jgi:hypothetical protein
VLIRDLLIRVLELDAEPLPDFAVRAPVVNVLSALQYE